MPAIPVVNIDPTLEAMKAEQEREAASQPPRSYMGMSSIGDLCDRKLWYQWRWMADSNFDALTLYRFADGHASEDIVADRLRTVPGVKLDTHNHKGEQFGYQDIGGHFRGHIDGFIVGILQAPKTKHIWEHKCVNEKKWKNLIKLVDTLGEKNALQEWDEVYYAQAVLYMHYADLKRHYLTCTTPGSREITSVRTDANPTHAVELIKKAESIICSEVPPAKVSQDPAFFRCKWCSFFDVCHGNAQPKKTCRSCKHAKPVENGEWECAIYKSAVPFEFQLKGCDQWASLV